MKFRTRSRYLPGLLLAALALAGCGGSASKSPGAYPAADAASPATAGGVASESEASPSDSDVGMAQPGAAPAPAQKMSEGRSSDGPRPTHGDFKEPAREPTNRPGLGTQWGETRQSSITTSPFVRADSANAFATGAFFYNDEEGARAMAGATGFKRFSEGGIDVGGGVATLRLKDGNGRFLSGFEAGGKTFAIGAAGDRYTIVLKSHVPARLEIVLSVDGLDVIDGKAASFTKRGYLVDPHGSIEVDGFRQSTETVAAFRFGSVRNSYAEKKHGESRNVGVIGIALFHEQGSNPSGWPRGEVQKRLDANPFPGQFATPPN